MSIAVFVPAPIPPDDFARGQVVLASSLLKSTPDPRLTLLAKIARDHFQTRWAGISLIAEDWQHVVASSGGMLGIYRRSAALSSYVVAYPDTVFTVLDATLDERFSGNPFVYDNLIRFYAGAAIRDSQGVVLGALCVTDLGPRAAFGPADEAELLRLAGKVCLGS